MSSTKLKALSMRHSSLSLFRWRRSAFRKRINFRLNDQSAIQAPTAWEVWTRAADNVLTITLTFNSGWWKSFSLQALITPTFHWYPSGLDTRLDLEFGRREFFSLTHKKRFPTNSAWRKAYIVFCALHQPRKSFGDAWTSITISQSGRSMKGFFLTKHQRLYTSTNTLTKAPTSNV